MKNILEQIHLQAIVPESMAGLRLDQALAELFPDYSRSRLQSWIHAHHVNVNGQQLRPRDKVRGGEQIIIMAPIERQETWQGQALPLNIIYQDDDLLIINKPAGIVVHPAAGHYQGTLVNALLHHFPENATLPRAGIIHRLDKDTSGLLVIAKTLTAHHFLVKQLQKRCIKREYEAIVLGTLTAGGTIDAPIGRHAMHRKRMAVIETGKPALSHYRIIKRFQAHTHIKVILETGRTHQIRVHMAHIHHPLLGDPVYGKRLQLPAGAGEELTIALRNFHRQALHAIRLELVHPSKQKYCEWIAPLPYDMQRLLHLLK